MVHIVYNGIYIRFSRMTWIKETLRASWPHCPYPKNGSMRSEPRSWKHVSGDTLANSCIAATIYTVNVYKTKKRKKACGINGVAWLPNLNKKKWATHPTIPPSPPFSSCVTWVVMPLPLFFPMHVGNSDHREHWVLVTILGSDIPMGYGTCVFTDSYCTSVRHVYQKTSMWRYSF